MDKKSGKTGLILLITGCLFFVVCQKSGNKYLPGEKEVINISPSLIPADKIAKKGNRLVCANLREISIHLSGKSKMVSPGKTRIKRDSLYIIDRDYPQIKVFTIKGKFVRDINIKPKFKLGFSYTNFLLTDDKRIIVKNPRQNEIIISDLNGNVLQRIDFTNNNNEGISLAGFDFCNIEGSDKVVSGLVQYDKHIFNEAYNIVVIDLKNGVENRFLRHSELMKKYNLTHFQPISFVVYNKRIFSVEQPLPYIRVLDFSGNTIKTFGSPGKHMKPIEMQPRQMNLIQIDDFMFRHTFHDALFNVCKIPGIYKDCILLVYCNKSDGILRSWGVLYDVDGELLYNDVRFPGYPEDVFDGNKIIFRKSIGHDKIELIAGEIVVKRNID